MKEVVNSYLEYLDSVLDCVPRKDMVCHEELLRTSYSLFQSSNILVEIQYLDYLICYMVYKRYISYKMFLELGGFLEKMVSGLRIT